MSYGEGDVIERWGWGVSQRCGGGTSENGEGGVRGAAQKVRNGGEGWG